MPWTRFSIFWLWNDCEVRSECGVKMVLSRLLDFLWMSVWEKGEMFQQKCSCEKLLQHKQEMWGNGTVLEEQREARQSGCYCLWKVCWRSQHGWATDLLSLPSPSSEQSHSVPTRSVPADGLAVPSWLPSNGWAAASEQDTARISSPSALHLNHRHANQRSGGASPWSTESGILHEVPSPPTVIHVIKAWENFIWLLRIWNTNILVSLTECHWYSPMYAALMVRLGPITLSLSQPNIHSSFSSHIKFPFTLRGSQYKRVPVSIYSLILFETRFSEP